MNGVRRIIFIVILFAVFGSPSGQNDKREARYITLYKQAEKLYYANSTNDALDSIALSTYLKVISLHPPEPDSILWDSYFKAGIFLQTAGKFREAIPYLKNAVSIPQEVPSIGEGLLYLPNLYLGNSYYSLSMLDSAVYYYKRSEDISGRHPYLDGIERLYNTLGAVNYESGDYQQSKIYFEKALQVVSLKKPANVPLIVNYTNNLASAMRKLKEYDQSMNIFNGLLKYNVNRDEILHNIGSIYLEQGKDSLAIVYLNKVRYNNQNKYNDLGIAYSRIDMMDSALAYFRKSSELNAKLNGDRKNIQYAITCKNLGDYYASKNDYDSALFRYQLAIIQLVFEFNDVDTRQNPAEFSGQFSVVELFEALSAKAKTFTLRYQAGNNKNDLISSIYAYNALYKLADYVIRTYNTEESRLLLTNRKHLSHTEPIDISLKLFDLTGDSVYLRHAFRFDEKNKAAVLALQLQESGSKRNAGLPSDLLEQEKQLTRDITKLQLQTVDISDSTTLAENITLIRDKQIQLAEVHKKFDEFPAYNNLKFIDNTTDVRELQKIIPSGYAVLTYHLGDTNMLSFSITHTSFRYFAQPIDTNFRKQVIEMYRMVQITDQNNTEAINTMSNKLYSMLIEPFSEEVEAADHLMIIPDDELSYLPFEMLRSNKGKMLVKSHSITYNYSCSLLKGPAENENKNDSVLAMAPFVRSLPESEKEIESIHGNKITGSIATKDVFVRMAPRYTVIHLATHASANDTDPSKSYIAFYAADTNASSSKLFTPEIAMLPLSNVKLVILSACETGAGQLVKGEGLMSLTRSFSYAGCQNTIASLWKADDVSTANISRKLHHYLEKEQPAAIALQHAMNDYLDEGDVPARFKTPAYWAHLRLVGTFAEVNDRGLSTIWIIAIAVVALALITYFSRRRS